MSLFIDILKKWLASIFTSLAIMLNPVSAPIPTTIPTPTLIPVSAVVVTPTTKPVINNVGTKCDPKKIAAFKAESMVSGYTAEEINMFVAMYNLKCADQSSESQYVPSPNSNSNSQVQQKLDKINNCLSYGICY